MGILGLVSNWLSDPKYEGVMTNKQPENVSSLSIDMNSILHAVSHDTDMNNLEKYFEDVVGTISTYVKHIHPSQLLILAVDGTAPRAKVEQQRMRRYRSAMERAPDAWDSNQITPGTEFMFKLDEYISAWLHKSRTTIGVKKVIYSSHMVPGEGEHKIMELLRKEAHQLDRSASHVVAGLDSDLILLTLNMSELLSMYLVRERISHTATNVVVQLEQWVNIELLSRYLGRDMHTIPKQAVKDFTVILCLIGNDFLPRITALQFLRTSIPYMLQTYASLKTNITDNGDINWTVMNNFINMVKSKELQWSKSLKDGNFVKFQAVETLVARKGTDWTISDYRAEYYKSVFKLVNPECLPSVLREDGDILAQVSDSKIKAMSEKYLTGIGWVFQYYTKGVANHSFVYPWRYAPLLHSLAEVMAVSPQSYMPVDGIPFVDLNALHVMLAVLPPRSGDIMPIYIRRLLTDIHFVDMFPLRVALDYEGTSEHTEHAAKTLVPPADYQRIRDAIKHAKISERDVLHYATGNLLITELTDEEQANIDARKAHNKAVNKLTKNFVRPRQPANAWRNPRLMKI